MSILINELTADDLEAALVGKASALTTLIERLTPIVQVRVARTILRRRFVANRPHLRQEVEDLIQEVLIALFADDARVLRKWDPERGLSLTNYVGLVAERLVSSILKSGKKTWPAEFVSTEELDRPAPDRDPEQRASSKSALRKVLLHLEEELSPQGWQMFQLIYLEDLSVDEVHHRTGMSTDAIYAWRSRLRQRTRGILNRPELKLATYGGPS